MVTTKPRVENRCKTSKLKIYRIAAHAKWMIWRKRSECGANDRSSQEVACLKRQTGPIRFSALESGLFHTKGEKPEWRWRGAVFELFWSPMSPYHISIVTSFSLALVGEVSFSRTSSECLEATLVKKAENKNNKAKELIQLAKGRNGRF